MAGIGINDRKLGAKVRSLTLKKIVVILQDDFKDKDFQKAVILKLASTVLPRINEHNGGADEEGNLRPVLVKFINGTEQDSRDSS